MFGRIALDLGDEFPILDVDGETPSEVHIESISVEGVVQIFKNQKHNIQDGDTVTFKEVVEEDSLFKSLNDTHFVVSNATRFNFQISGFR